MLLNKLIRIVNWVKGFVFKKIRIYVYGFRNRTRNVPQTSRKGLNPHKRSYLSDYKWSKSKICQTPPKCTTTVYTWCARTAEQTKGAGGRLPRIQLTQNPEYDLHKRYSQGNGRSQRTDKRRKVGNQRQTGRSS